MDGVYDIGGYMGKTTVGKKEEDGKLLGRSGFDYTGRLR